MKLPYAEHATVDIHKLRGYALNLDHGTGKHKARKFAAILNLMASDADELRDILLDISQTYEAESLETDSYGRRYRIDFMLEWKGRSALVRSGWVIAHDSNVPRLTTCYVL